MTEEEIKKECERLFQNGGPKVYLYQKNRGTLRPMNVSAAKALRYDAEDGDQVWHRGKVGNVYRWKVQHKAIA